MKQIFDYIKTRSRNQEPVVLANNGFRAHGIGRLAALFVAVIMLLTSNAGMAQKRKSSVPFSPNVLQGVSYPRGYAYPELRLKIDELVEDLMAEEKLPGMTIAVSVGAGRMNRARLVASIGYGKANTATNKPMKYFSNMMLGSVTKPLLVGGALMQLMKPRSLYLPSRHLGPNWVSAGKSIDPKKQKLYGPGGLFKNKFKADILKGIARHNPTDDWMKWYRKITIQNLLDHRAGFGSASSAGAARMFKTTKELVTYDQIHRHFLRTTEPHFEPGTSYKYSNHGFGVLGMLVIKKLSGKSFQAYVQKNYLKQWRLDGYIRPLSTNPEYFDANPHEYDSNGNPVPMAFWNSIRPAAGGFTACAQDLIKLMVGLETKYSDQELDDMGWFKGPGGNLRHNGRLKGGTAFAIMFPGFPKRYTSNSGQDISYVKVVVMTNISTSTNKLKTLAANIANEVSLANIPKTYDIWKIKQARPSLAKTSLAKSSLAKPSLAKPSRKGIKISKPNSHYK